MSYAMGWWDFVESDTPQMIHRYTGERVVRSGPLGEGLAPPGEPWFRFDYQSAGLHYPLAVLWAPEQGEIVIDHNRSAQLSRQSGAADEYPRWGAYARVDDLAADAFWCWPGIVDIAMAQMRGIARPFAWSRDGAGEPRADEPLLAIFRLGSYSNREWHENFVIEDVLDLTRCRLRGDDWDSSVFTSFGGRQVCWDLREATFRTHYGQAVQNTNRLVLAPDCVPPIPYEYARRDGLKPDEVDSRRKRIWPFGGLPQPTEDSRWPATLVSGLPPHAISGNNSVVAIVGDQVPPRHGHGGPWYWQLASWNGTRPGLHPQLRVTSRFSRYVGGPFAGPRYATALLSVGFGSDGDGELTLGPSRNCFSVPLYDAAPILIREMIDAIFAWRDVASLMDDWHRSFPWSKVERRTSDRFDLVAITSRFLGGRAVRPRGQLAYFS